MSTIGAAFGRAQSHRPHPPDPPGDVPYMSLLNGETIAILGGTGPQGRGLARRFAQAGLTVVLGSRTAEKGAQAAAELSEATGTTVTGTDNQSAAEAGDIVLVVVPWDGHGELLSKL